MSGFVREISEGGTTRYSDTGCSAAIRSAMRQSQREVTSATVGSRYRPRNDMAVLNTPERSLSDLLSTSRAADATTGCGLSPRRGVVIIRRSEEHTSELQSLMRISYAVCCLKTTNKHLFSIYPI